MDILNTRETKKLRQEIMDTYGSTFDESYVFIRSKKENIYIANRECFDLDLTKLRVNSIGLYIGEEGPKFRLSFEGSQIIGKKATKNKVQITKKELKEWMRGEPLMREEESNEFVLIEHKGDFFGVGKPKEKIILNYVPKIKRINTSD